MGGSVRGKACAHHIATQGKVDERSGSEWDSNKGPS
jgi:hypothetical protein